MIRTQIVEAIILGQRDFGEADRLYTVFTKQTGKLTVLGKGVRRIRSRRGGNLDVLNDVMLTLARGQSLHLITEASVVNSYSSLKDNVQKVFYGYYLVELVDALTMEMQEQQQVFYLLRNVLDVFAQHPRRIYILYFELRLLALLGFISVEEMGTKNKEVLALAQAISVQSAKELGKKEYPDAIVQELSAVVRKQLVSVTERELKSPQIMAQLKQLLSNVE